MVKPNQNTPVGPVEVSDAKKRSMVAGFLAFIAVVGSAVFGFLVYPEILSRRVIDWLHNDRDKLPAMTDFYHKYNCDTDAAFQQMLNDNSTKVTKFVLENGVFTEKTTYSRNAYATVAELDYHQVYDAILNNPQDYVVMNYPEIALIIAIPVIFIILFLVYFHKYRVLKRRLAW